MFLESKRIAKSFILVLLVTIAWSVLAFGPPYAEKPVHGSKAFKESFQYVKLNDEGNLVEFSSKNPDTYVFAFIDAQVEPVKSPIILTGGLFSNTPGYADWAMAMAKQGHPIYITSPPGHGAHQALNAYPNKMYMLEDGVRAIESAVDFIGKNFNQTPVIAGHSLGGIISSLYMYGAYYDAEARTYKVSTKVAKKRWGQIKSTLYLNSPLPYEFTDESIDQLRGIFKPYLSHLGMEGLDLGLDFLGMVRNVTEGNSLIGRASSAYLGNLARYSLPGLKLAEPTFLVKGMMDVGRMNAEDIELMIKSGGVTANVPSGIKLPLMTNTIYPGGALGENVFKYFTDEGVYPYNPIGLKQFVKDLVTNIKKGERSRTSFGIEPNRIKLTQGELIEIMKIIESNNDIKKLFLNPGLIGKNKPSEISLASRKDPLGNWKMMSDGFADSELGRYVLLNNEGHLGPMVKSFAIHYSSLLSESLERPQRFFAGGALQEMIPRARVTIRKALCSAAFGRFIKLL